jgi:hypothetical protein
MGPYIEECDRREAEAARARAEQLAELDEFLVDARARQAELEATFAASTPPPAPPMRAKPAAASTRNDDGCEVTRDGWVVRRNEFGQIIETIGLRYYTQNGMLYHLDERTGEILETRRLD